MRKVRVASRHSLRNAIVACALAWCAFGDAAFAADVPYHLAPFTKLRLTVVQFVKTSGDYKKWDALGGDLEVSQDGNVLVPALGEIAVGDQTVDDVAAAISAKLQVKLGLMDAPDATLQIVEYPPIFLTGAVAAPGQYPFRPGMTVLQAVAVAGGEYRADSKDNPNDVIRLQSDLQGAASDILRSTARLARLNALLANATEITFPATMDAKDPTTTEMMQQERTIFSAQRNELQRQVTGLNDLTTLYRAELDALDQKSKSIDDEIAASQQQLDGVKQLVAKGVVVQSRQTDMARDLAGLRSDHLDNVIATMNARRGMSEATRDLAKLEDDQQSQASIQLQTEQTNLEHLQLTQTTLMRVLLQSTKFPGNDDKQEIGTLTYVIVRPLGRQPTEIAATDDTPVEPGDLLKVSVNVGPPQITDNAGGTSP